MAPPKRRSCAICEAARGRMITCRRCLQYYHPTCEGITDEEDNLKQLEKTFVCIVCKTSTEDNVEKELEPSNTADVNRYTAAVSRTKISQSIASAESLRGVGFVGTREAIALSRSISSLPDTIHKPTTAAKRPKAGDKKPYMAAKRSRLSLDTDDASTDSWQPTKAKKPAKKQKKQGKRNDVVVLDIMPSDAAEADEKTCLEHCRDAPSGTMIACDKCDVWYHFACVAMSQAEADMIDNYYCDRCVQYPGVAITYKGGTPLESRNRSRIPLNDIVTEVAKEEAPHWPSESCAKAPSTSNDTASHVGEPSAGNPPSQDTGAGQEALIDEDGAQQDLEEHSASASSDETSQVCEPPAGNPPSQDVDARQEALVYIYGTPQDIEEQETSASSDQASQVREPPADNHPSQDVRQEALVDVVGTPEDAEEHNASASSGEASQVDYLSVDSPSVLDAVANHEPVADVIGREQDHEDGIEAHQKTPAQSDATDADAARSHDSGCYSQQASPDQVDENAHVDSHDDVMDETENAVEIQVRDELREEDPAADYQLEEAKENPDGEQEDVAEVDWEEPEDYDVTRSNGLYYLARAGDCLNEKYYVYRKLGYGTFGTVWLCLDDELQRMVAVKIAKAGQTCSRNAREEVNQLNTACVPSAHPGRTHVIDLLEVFDIDGENGWPHVCTVFPVGESLLTYTMKVEERTGRKALPLEDVRRIMREILLGLDYLSTEAKMVHLDLKLENVLLMCKQEVALNKAYKAITEKKLKPHYVAACDAEAGLLKIPRQKRKNLMAKLKKAYAQLHEDTRQEFTVCIADLGSAESITSLRKLKGGNTLQTSHYRAPETVLQTLGDGYGPWMDVWSAGCIAFELATGDLLFKPRHDSEGFEDEHDLLTQVYEALGAFPEHVLDGWSKSARRYAEFFQDRKLHLCVEVGCTPWPVEDVLQAKYGWREADATKFGKFLRALLDYDIKTRPSASDCLRLQWLYGDQDE